MQLIRMKPFFSLFLFSIVLTAAASAADFYVDSITGDDLAVGSESHPFATIARAIKEVDGPGGTIYLQPGMMYPEEVVIRKGGTEIEPLIIEGRGAIINLGTEVTDGPWMEIGEQTYRLERAIPKFKRHYVTSPLFVNGLPLWAGHPEGRGKPAWHGGSLSYDDAGRMVVRFPDGLSPENARIVLTGTDGAPALHASGGQHVILRDLTAAFAGNDGFNFHNHCRDFRLERVRAVFNGDQGISSHGQCEVGIFDSEVGFNGSQSAGIVDINDAVTKYVGVLSHDNRNGGFLLRGQSHYLESVVAFGNQGPDLPRPEGHIEVVNSKGGEACLPDGFPKWGNAHELSQREARFEAMIPRK